MLHRVPVHFIFFVGYYMLEVDICLLKIVGPTYGRVVWSVILFLVSLGPIRPGMLSVREFCLLIFVVIIKYGYMKRNV